MHNQNYYDIASFEKKNWWYHSRRHLLDVILNSFKISFADALDAGCGVGSNSGVLRKYSNNLIGIDKSYESDVFSRHLYDAFVRASLDDFCMKKHFDLIICLDVLEHIDDDVKTLKNIVSHLTIVR